MKVDVLIFGQAAATKGSDRVTVTVSETPTVAEVSGALLQQCPDLAFALSPPRLAVNLSLAQPECAIRPGDEVALITLLGGG